MMGQREGDVATPLLDSRPGQLSEPERARVTVLLERRLQAARERYPGLEVDAHAFAAFLASRLAEPGAALDEALGALCIEDLYLAFGCGHGDAEAVRIFHRDFLAKVPELVARMRGDHAAGEDVQQTLSLRLLLPDGDSPPDIFKYGGTGALIGWLKQTARFEAHNQVRGKAHTAHDTIDHKLEQALFHAGDASGIVRRIDREKLRSALRHALSRLSPEQRAMLRLGPLREEQSSVLGALLGLHDYEVRRKLKQVRDALREETIAFLVAEHGLTKAEAETFSRSLAGELASGLSSLIGH